MSYILTIRYHVAAEKKYGPIDSFSDLLKWKGTFDYPNPITTGAGFSAIQTMIQDFPKDRSGTQREVWKWTKTMSPSGRKSIRRSGKKK